jgi:hypothetical protein
MNTRMLTTAACSVLLGVGAVAGCAAEETTPGTPTSAGNVNGAGDMTAVTSSGVTSGGPVTDGAVGSSTAVTNGGATSDTSGGAGAAVTTTGAAAVNDTSGGATTGASTTGGSTGSCSGSTPASAAVTLMPQNGYVSCDSNTIGLQGYFFTYADMGGSTIMPANFEMMGSDICVNGTAGQVMDMDYDATYGAGLGFNFNQDTGSTTPNTWNATAMGIGGIAFTISAFPAGATMRIIFQSGGSDFCHQFTTGGPHTVTFAEAQSECWSSAGTAPNAASLQQVKWQVATDEAMAYPFDFCLTNVQLVP